MIEAPMRRFGRVGLWAACVLVTVAAGAGAIARQSATRGPGLENFHLDGPAGRIYSIESFPADTVLVIYFGYTTCLKACPTALNSIAEAIDQLGPLSASVQPVFIDMDPERAAVASMRLFMQSFGPSFLGLTGSADQIERAAQTFNVQVERIQFGADPADYAMKHTSPIFIMRPGDPHPSSLPPTSSPALVATALRKALE